MDFNFNSLETTSFTSTSGQYLRPYDIYKVNLTKIEKTELKGSKDPNATYPIVALEFTGCEDNKGVFTTNLFIPVSDQDMTRPTLKNKEGHEYEVPSRFEDFQYTLMQIVHALNPEGEAKIKANASKIKTIDQFIELITKALAGKDKIETKLKLVGKNNNGTIYASLPKACALNKSGEIYPKNFIGNDVVLAFDNWETTQMNAYKNAKPTNMDSVDSSSDDVDIDNLEL